MNTGTAMEPAKKSADLLLRHGHIITMDKTRRILLDGVIAISDGRIVGIGPDREITSVFEAREVRDLKGALVHPGLVDAHAHTDMDLVRGLLPEAKEWGIVERPFTSTKTEEEEYLSALLVVIEMVRSGTTLFSDTGKSFNLAATMRALDLVGIRGMPGFFVADQRIREDKYYDAYFSPTRSADECLSLLERQVETYPFHSEKRVRCIVALQASGTSSDRLLSGAKALADRKHVPMVMHQSWNEAEVQKSLNESGKRPMEHLADLGILSPSLTLAHMNYLSDREIEILKESGACVVHCPNPSLRRGIGAIRNGRFPEMMDAGITVALGSDGWGGKHDIMRQAYLAVLGFREFRNAFPVITKERALEMATINGARALGMLDEVGSLEVGKRADVVIHGLDVPGMRYNDPVHNLIYYSQSGTVDTVIVDGETIYDGGRFTRFDLQDAVSEIDRACAAREKTIGLRGGVWPLVS